MRPWTAIFLLFLGCAGSGKIISSIDDAARRRTDRSSGNRIGPLPCGLTRDPCIYLEAERIILGNDSPRFRFVAVYEGEEWLFIQPGKTLEFELENGQGFSLYGEGSKEERKILGEKKLRETAAYEVSLNNLARIAEAPKARVKIHGEGFYVERSLTTENKKVFRRFLEKFGPKTPKK